MTTRAAYPPIRRHSSKKIPYSEAQELLASFLDKTLTSAHLHPDAMLAQNGVQFPAQNGPQGGIIMHHLRRIEAGLRGEDMIAQSNDELKALFDSDAHLPSGDDSVFEERPRKKSRREQSADKVATWSQDAQDPDDYARAQEVVEEELGDDLAGQGEQGAEPRVGKIDKQARKDAKKAKKKAEKKAGRSAREAAAG